MRKRTRAVIVLLLIVAVLTAIFFYFRSHMNPAVIELSKMTVTQLASNAINDAAYSAIPTTSSYNDFVDVTTDADGQVTMLRAKTGNINEIVKVALERAQQNIDAIGNQVLKIPSGAVSGLAIFSGQGQNINFNVLPVGQTSAKFISDFESAGINQTVHKIYLELIADVIIVLPTIKEPLQVTAAIPICETVLVGKVPEVFLGFNADDILNLVP